MPGPTLEELKAKPGWGKLSPEAQALAAQKYGTGNQDKTKDTVEQKDALGKTLSAVGSGAASLATGAAKGAGSTAYGVGKFFNEHSFIGGQTGVYPPKPDELTPQGGLENVGFTGEQIAELVAGGGAKGGLTLAGKLASAGLGTAAVRGAQTGGDVKESAVAGVLGAGGALPGRLAAMRGGAKALQAGGVDAARSRLPELLDAIDLAKLKGAIPGHGFAPKSLLEELSAVRQTIATGEQAAAEEAAQAAAQKAGPSGLEKALGFLLRTAMPNTARKGAKLVDRMMGGGVVD